jgi:hypothetical protein
MKFVAGGINGEYLKGIHLSAKNKTDSIKMAIAYAAGDPEILKDNLHDNVKITFWGRYDSTVPISTPILKRFLDKKSPNYECKLVPDIFHAKIIWWEDFGAYIGSANLTDRAWYNNIEAGIFVTHEELLENNLILELNGFFDELDTFSTPLTDEIYNELCELQQRNIPFDKQKKRKEAEFDQRRLIPKLNPLIRIPDKKEKKEKRKNNFLQEWYATLQILRNIAERVSRDDYRPNWIGENVPQGVQADQFLHAYYYSQIRQGNVALHHKYYGKNRKNPDEALCQAMSWWKSLGKAPHSEDVMINDWAIYLKKEFQRDRILFITKSEFLEICSKVHALRDHALRVRYSVFGFTPPYPQMKHDERIKLLSDYLYESRSNTGKSIIETLYYLLYGGPQDKTPDRLWDVATSAEWSISHFGISSAGEIVGWAMPDIFPPRNGRTSKSLTALGFNVKIHSE